MDPPDRGSASAEAAVVLPVLVLVLAVVLWVVGAVAAQLSCVDAARTAARAASRGESAAGVAALVRAAGPPGTRVSIRPGSTTVVVTVEAAVRPPAVLGLRLPGLPVRATATAALEPGVGAAP